MLQRFYQSIADALFPLSCVGCGDGTSILCNDCLAVSSRPLPAVCPRCVSSPAIGGLLCPSCKKQSPLTGIVTASNYRNPVVQAAIHTLKFDGVRVLIPPLTDLLADALSSSHALSSNKLLVAPVPLHPRAARSRGFDQSLLLSLALGEKLNIPITPALLRRRRLTLPQRHLNRAERQTNIRNAFTAIPAEEKETTILLVDDVLTTGATMEEAARTLQRNGWKTIWGLAVASADLNDS